MVMEIAILGCNHKTMPVELRERLAVSDKRLSEALPLIRTIDGVEEAVMLSTCNRVEVCSATRSPESFFEGVVTFFENETGVGTAELQPHLYRYCLPDSVRHLFEVACGLDSMVVGEPQILGQVKAAYQRAQEIGTTGKILSGTFQRAFTVAKRVRTETAIGENPVSVASVAVHLGKKVLGDLSGNRVLIVGAGKMGTVTARALLGQGASSLVVSSRNYEHAQVLAGLLGGEAARFAELETGLQKADIVISSTNAPHPILSFQMLERVMRARRHRPLFVIDLAVPRDVEAKAATIPDLFLYDIDALQEIVQEHIHLRREEIARCDAIVFEELTKFLRWQESIEADELIKELNARWDTVKQEELARAFNRLSDLSERDRDQIEQLATRIVNRLKHPSIRALKNSDGARQSDSAVDRIRHLLGLGD
jgi:glutamyl-tRNA reductase